MDVRNRADSKNDLDTHLKIILPLIFNKHDQQWWSREIARIVRNNESIKEIEAQINLLLSQFHTIPDHLFLEGKDFVKKELENLLNILHAYRKYKLTGTLEDLHQLCVACHQADYPVVPIDKTIDLSRFMHTEMTNRDGDRLVEIIRLTNPTLLLADCHIGERHAVILRDVFAQSSSDHYRIYFGNVSIEPTLLCDVVNAYCKNGWSATVTIKLDRNGVTCICLQDKKRVLRLNLEEVDIETRKKALADFAKMIPQFSHIDLGNTDDTLLLEGVLPIMKSLETKTSTPYFTIKHNKLTLNGVIAFASDIRFNNYTLFETSEEIEEFSHDDLVAAFLAVIIFETIGQRLTPHLNAKQLLTEISKDSQTILPQTNRDLLLLIYKAKSLKVLEKPLQQLYKCYHSAAHFDAKEADASQVSEKLKMILDAVTGLRQPWAVLPDAKEPVQALVPAAAPTDSTKEILTADLYLYLAAVFRKHDKELWRRIIKDLFNPENPEDNDIEYTEIQINQLVSLLHLIPDAFFLKGKQFFIQELAIFIRILHRYKACLQDPHSLENLCQLYAACYESAYPYLPFNIIHLSQLAQDEMTLQNKNHLVKLVNQFQQPIQFKGIEITQEHLAMLKDILSRCVNARIEFINVRIHSALLHEAIHAYCKNRMNCYVGISIEDETTRLILAKYEFQTLEVQLLTTDPKKRKESLIEILKTAFKFSTVILDNCQLEDNLLLEVILPFLKRIEFTSANFEEFSPSGNNFTLDGVMQFANHLRTGNTFHHERLIVALIVEKVFIAICRALNPPPHINELHEYLFNPNQTILHPADCKLLLSLGQMTSLSELQQALRRLGNNHQAVAEAAIVLPDPAEIDDIQLISRALSKLLYPKTQLHDAKLLSMFNDACARPDQLPQFINAQCQDGVNRHVRITIEHEKVEYLFAEAKPQVLEVQLKAMGPKKRKEFLTAILKAAPKFSKVILENCHLDDDLLLEVILPSLKENKLTFANVDVFNLRGNDFTLDGVMQLANHLKTGDTFHHERTIIALIVEKIFAVIGQSLNPSMDGHQLYEKLSEPNQTIFHREDCADLLSLHRMTSLRDLEQTLQRFCNSYRATENTDAKAFVVLSIPAEIDELKLISHALTKLFRPQTQLHDAKLVTMLDAQKKMQADLKKQALKKQFLDEHRANMLNDVATKLKDFMQEDEFTFKKLQDYLLDLFKHHDVSSISLALANLITLNKHWTHLDILLQIQFSWHFGLQKVNLVAYNPQPEVMASKLNCFRKSHANNSDAKYDEKAGLPLTTTLFFPRPNMRDFFNKFNKTSRSLIGSGIWILDDFLECWHQEADEDYLDVDLESLFFDQLKRTISHLNIRIQDTISTAPELLELFNQATKHSDEWAYYFQTKDMPERLPNRKAVPEVRTTSPGMP